MNPEQKTILHLIDTTGPGGAETVFTQLAAETQRRGWRSIALIRGRGWVASELNRLGVETVIRDCKGSINFGFLKFLITLIQKEKIDLIQSHLLGSNVYASIAGIITRKPVLSTFHGFVDISSSERFRLAKFLSIKFGSSAIIAVTDQIKEMLIEKTPLSSRKTRVIANGIDTDLFGCKSSYALPSSIRIGCLGNVRKAKNYPLAIQVLQKLLSRGVDARLHIAGDNTNKLAKECQELALALGVENNIHWEGFISDAPAFLQKLDIFMLCSSSEGHPLALTQAMSVGLPIVTTACGVENVITPGESALVSENENSDALVNNIVSLIEDASYRESIGLAAAKEARDYWSLTKMLNEYFSLYDLKVSR